MLDFLEQFVLLNNGERSFELVFGIGQISLEMILEPGVNLWQLVLELLLELEVEQVLVNLLAFF